MARAAVKLRWYGNRIAKEIKADLNARLRIVGALVTSRIMQNLSTTGPLPSMPHEFPHAQSGYLRSGVTFEVDEATTSLQIIVPAEYASYLEDGTRNKDGSQKMAPRPFIQKTIDECIPEIIQTMTTPRKSLLARAIGAVSDAVFGSSGGFSSTRE